MPCVPPALHDDAPGFWDTWVGMGGEGIVLKDRESIYWPGVRSLHGSSSSRSSPWPSR
jgi:hypothetical protein